MYLSKLKLWNFRKYGVDGSIDTLKPHFEIAFKKGLNVLVGENDAGKTAIVDAIRYVLKTQSGEFIQIDEKDFYQSNDLVRAKEMRIECEFMDLNDLDCGLFWEWLSFNQDGKFFLKIVLTAKRKDNDIMVFHSAGNSQNRMDGNARKLLRPVYLKPLRDALTDMTHGHKSRLSQILSAHKLFQEKKDDRGCVIPHELENLYKNLKNAIDNYFDSENGKDITNGINVFLKKHFLLSGDVRSASIRLTAGELTEILRQLDLLLESNKSGLGTLNLLCMAAELLLMSSQEIGLKLALIEELEAHLHPQYQLRLMNYIKDKTDEEQFILTTHSITLASNVPLKSITVVNDKHTYPMSQEFTGMNRTDYRFMERFLDATKSNLFFARGVILVEGDAENILIPTIADVIGFPLHEYGVSVVNVGSTAYKRYVRLFQRNGEPLKVPIAVITDLDVRSIEYYKDKGEIKSVWKMDNDLKNAINCITDQLEVDKLPDLLYTKTEVENAIQVCKKNDVLKLDKNVKDDVLNLFTEDRKSSITEADIATIRKKKHEQIEEQNTQYVNFFAPKEWTLEYDIARSSLARDLYQARLMACYEQSTGFISHTNDTDVLKKIANQVQEDYPNGNVITPDDSYKIFEPLNDGRISKAITAQYLAEIIQEDHHLYKDKILSDSYLSYIVEAIKFVTKA